MGVALCTVDDAVEWVRGVSLLQMSCEIIKFQTGHLTP